MRKMLVVLAFVAAFANSAAAQLQPCGTIATTWDAWYFGPVGGTAVTSRSHTWATFCGGNLQSEVWLEGYSGYGMDNKPLEATGIIQKTPYFWGTTYAHTKHYWIAPLGQWHLLINGLDSVWVPEFTPCSPPGGGCSLEGEVWDPEICECTGGCPLVLDTGDNGFKLTDLDNGVDFDLNTDGIPERVSWTTADSDDGWLVLDRNGNGTIDNGSELFGNFTSAYPNQRQPIASHGFDALKSVEGAGYTPNLPDGWINPSDSIFSQLRVWIDANHNGLSEPAELHTPASLGLLGISTKAQETRRRDAFGNLFKLRAPSLWRGENGRIDRRVVYDVWLMMR